MEYKGVVENGVIRPFEPTGLPDGTEVTFHEVGVGEEMPPSPPDDAAWQPMEKRFWRGFSIEDLAHEQRVTPVTSVDELAGEWPEEDDLDEFLRSIREWRS